MNIRARVDKILEMRFGSTSLTRHHQGREPVLTRQIDIGAVVDEQLHAAEVTHGTGVVQRRVAMVIHVVHIRIGKLQKFNDLGRFSEFGCV